MTSDVKFSVAIVTYNGAAFVERQLESILQQSRPVDEIVLSDDGSSDDTLQRVRALFSKNSRLFKLLTHTGKPGIAANVERAVRKCNGEIIALADQDDIWHYRKIEVILETFSRRPAACVLFGDARVVDSNEVVLSRSLFDLTRLSFRERAFIRAGKAFEVFLTRNVATGATMAFRRSATEMFFPIPAGWMHDEWIATIAAAVDAIDLVETPLTDYRQHDANSSGGVPVKLAQRLQLFITPNRAQRIASSQRAGALVARLSNMKGVSAHRVQAAAEKAKHLDLRASLPSGHLRRLGPIIREFTKGGYSQYSTGWRAAIRDLVQRLD